MLSESLVPYGLIIGHQNMLLNAPGVAINNRVIRAMKKPIALEPAPPLPNATLGESMDYLKKVLSGVVSGMSLSH